jgi:hypothetical protein
MIKNIKRASSDEIRAEIEKEIANLRKLTIELKLRTEELYENANAR